MPHGAAADWCKLLYINFSDRSFWVCWECVVGKLLLAAPLRLFLFPSIDDQRQVRNANILLLIYCWIISIRYPVCRQKVGEGGFMFRVLLFICADKTLLFYLIFKCLSTISSCSFCFLKWYWRCPAPSDLFNTLLLKGISTGLSLT